MASHGGAELTHKRPHWGDAILCDGLLYQRSRKSEAPANAARAWFSPRLATGPRTDGWDPVLVGGGAACAGPLYPNRRAGLSRLRACGRVGAGV